MAFKMKGFPMHKGVSPMRQGKDDPSNDPSYDPSFGAEKGNYPTETVTTTPPVVEEEDKDSEQGTKTGDLSNVIPKTSTTKNEDGADLGDGLDKLDKRTEEEKLRAQSKKEMYANAWQQSGAGHIVEAVKSIRRGIKNLKAKKAKRVEGARTAVGSGTETLKQAKLVKRANERDARKAKKAAKDKAKLAKWRKKNKKAKDTNVPPVTDKEEKKS